MYDNYLLSRITNRIIGVSSSIPNEQNTTAVPKIEKPRKSIITAYSEYLDLCISQNLSQGVIHAKKRVIELLKENRIKYLDESIKNYSIT